jgi:hypothetical protein
MRRNLVLAFAMAVTAGCSPATQGSGAGPRSSTNVLTRQEISASPYQATNAYEAVDKLRPGFLRPRTTSSGPGYLPTLFIDGIRKGSVDLLRSISSNEIAEIRYLSVQDATTRYGLNVPAGVLDVKLVGR